MWWCIYQEHVQSKINLIGTALQTNIHIKEQMYMLKFLCYVQCGVHPGSPQLDYHVHSTQLCLTKDGKFGTN